METSYIYHMQQRILYMHFPTKIKAVTMILMDE